MIIRDIFLFLLVQLALVCFSFAEAYQEGPNAWKWNPKWWRIPLPGGYWYHAYHIFIFFGTLPLLIFGLPLILVGWNTHLMLVLLFSYLVGTTLEDFVFFLVNPEYPFKKWNPKDTSFYPWLTVGKFSLPVSYILKLTASLFILYLLRST